jgi:hypothetical protein
MSTKLEFIDKLNRSKHTDNLLYILNNKRYEDTGEIYNHKKEELISALLKIFDEPLSMPTNL